MILSYQSLWMFGCSNTQVRFRQFLLPILWVLLSEKLELKLPITQYQPQNRLKISCPNTPPIK